MDLTKLDELTYPAIRQLIDDGATTMLLPVGTLEAHGRHAPVGTDNFCAEDISWQLGRRTGWPVAPTLNYGITTGMIPYPGSIKIPKEVYERLIATILENFLDMGFRRIIIINGHGGNTETITKVIKDLIEFDYGNRHLIMVDWWHLAADSLKEVYGRPGGHAALDETACIAAFRPELLDPDAMDPNNYTRLIPGIVSAPYSTAMIVYGDGDATPDFDTDKGQGFHGQGCNSN